MKNKIGTVASRTAAIILLFGSLGAAGCAVFVPADSVTPQVSEGSRTTTTTTTQSNVPDPSVSTTEKTTTVKTTSY